MDINQNTCSEEFVMVVLFMLFLLITNCDVEVDTKHQFIFIVPY